MLRALLLLLVALLRVAAQDEQTQVPDPLGLGERLALIDYLQTHGQSVTPGADLSQLRSAYRDLTGAATIGSADAEKSARDEAVLVLWRSYNVVAPENETLAQLQKRLVDLASSSANASDIEQLHERADARAAAAATQLAPGPANDAGAQNPDSDPATHGPSRAPAAADDAGGGAVVQEVTRPSDMSEQVHAYLISPGASPILLVCLNPELLEPVRSILRTWPAEDRVAAGITSTVIIHCHSSGTYFSPGVLTDALTGGDLSEHLRRNREYYETLAGTRERKIIDFAVMTGCNPSGSDQESQLRDGFGYRPVHRVFTAPGSYDAASVVLPAIMMTGTQPYLSDSPYHASYTWYRPITVDGKPITISCYASIDDDALDIKNGLHRFLVSPEGVKEQAPSQP